jgi:hypothetical protein
VPTTYSDETELNMHARLLAHINNLIDDVSNTRTLVNSIRTAFGGLLEGSKTHDFGNLADAAGESTDVTVTGAALGDYAVASLGVSTQGMTLTATVTAADTVTVRLQNESGGALDLASTTLRVLVFDRSVLLATLSAAAALAALKT